MPDNKKILHNYYGEMEKVLNHRFEDRESTGFYVKASAAVELPELKILKVA